MTRKLPCGSFRPVAIPLWVPAGEPPARLTAFRIVEWVPE